MRTQSAAERRQSDFEENEMRLQEKRTPWKSVETYVLPIFGQVDILTRWDRYKISTCQENLIQKQVHYKNYGSLVDARKDILTVCGNELRKALDCLQSEESLRNCLIPDPYLANQTQETKPERAIAWE